MAPAQATKNSASEKKRVSKAVKRKAKKPVEPEESEDDEPEVKPKGKAAVEKTEEAPEASEKKEKRVKTKANRFEQMAAKADEEEVEPRGVIYVGHIPDGFFEPQMRKFLGQFGKVTRLRISRSKKNAKSKGYAFVEFEDESVAKIVAETMQGYLLFGKTLVCHVLEKQKCHPSMFKGCKRRMINPEYGRRRAHLAGYNDRPFVEVDGEKVPLRTARQGDRQKKSDKKLKALLADLGVDYDMDGVDAKGSKSPKLAASSSPKVAPKVSPKLSPKVAPKVSPKLSPKAPAAAAAGAAGSKKKKRKIA